MKDTLFLYGKLSSNRLMVGEGKANQCSRGLNGQVQNQQRLDHHMKKAKVSC
ncbi:hypothetical protein HMPREF0493_0195 [Lactobacillus amylolyticus DSM 11664]|uniref:Uncharacterized protein n=1 Tax=Lactobacillus amylolyticus DSM 11664 TaxID=585524 RepID=D4YRR7_9LACO|nr:hypothetical protein HMPREF0493_0195 [Lactobacillus amylolyticus DSM 11664]